MKKNSGITLIALVITIIVLLILAGVTISIVGGSDGIIAKAEKAVSETDKAAMQEDAELAIVAIKMDYYENYSANRASYENAKAFIVAELQKGNYKTSRGATMMADSAGEVTYTYKGVSTVVEIDENGSVSFGESSGSGGDSEEEIVIVEGSREDWDITDDGTITFFKGTVPADGTLIVPNMVDGIAVKKIESTEAKLSVIYNTEEYSFEIYNTSVKNIVISEGIENIGARAFICSANLESVIIPDSVTSIGSSAFNICTSLSSINIPDSVTSIGTDAFSDTAWYNNQADGVVYAGKVLYTYKGAMPSNTNITVAEGTKGIAGDAFEYITNLKSINIPEGVISIEDYAFFGCINLSTINIPSSVTRIGSYAFGEWTGSQTINFEIQESNIPSTWSATWDAFSPHYTGDKIGAKMNWGVSI